MIDIYSTVRGGYRAAKNFRKSPQDKLLSLREITALLDSASTDSSSHGMEAWSLFALAGNFGLRCGEALNAVQDDFKSLSIGYFRVRTLKKRGEQEDRIYADGRHQKLVDKILKLRNLNGTPHLFPFSTRTARYLFAYYAERAGISPNVSFHALRHTAAHMVFNTAGSIPELAPKAMNIVNAFLRHKPMTTEVYTYPSAEEMLRVMEKKEVVR